MCLWKFDVCVCVCVCVFERVCVCLSVCVCVCFKSKCVQELENPCIVTYLLWSVSSPYLKYHIHVVGTSASLYWTPQNFKRFLLQTTFKMNTLWILLRFDCCKDVDSSSGVFTWKQLTQRYTAGCKESGHTVSWIFWWTNFILNTQCQFCLTTSWWA
jgi:hypothetical protein